MSNVSAADAVAGGKVDERVGGFRFCPSDHCENTMTAHPATATRVRTGGPKDDGPEILEHIMGWVLVLVIAVLVTRLGLL
ncbi:SCO1431 family membrane protein [Streptomyces sp. NPDC003388]|uniref:SCO1431 family membrane protein n=1 Tax=unclassified Streptomyces TaxID=2593676 RepID=UPI0033C2437A